MGNQARKAVLGLYHEKIKENQLHLVRELPSVRGRRVSVNTHEPSSDIKS